MPGGTYWDLKGILSEIRSNYNCFDEEEEPYYRALSDAIRLISAKPEVTEEEVKEYCRKRCLSIVDSALLKKYASEGPEPRWIPCSERLPKEGQDILAYKVFGDDERIIPANYGNGCWFDCHMNCSVGHVVAWMPLPKPYEGEQNGDENE